MAADGGVPKINIKNARKELGLGLPPDVVGCVDESSLIAHLCMGDASSLTVVEVADWTIDLPIADQDIGTTFGATIDVWSTQNGKPPSGVAYASNTLATPGQVPGDMIIQGLTIRVLVEPEARTIRGNALFPNNVASIPGSPDVWSANDLANNGIGIAEGQTGYIPADLLWGYATWKAAYAFMQAYELEWSQAHDELLTKEPLSQAASVQPFSEAEAAGLAFISNQICVAESNARLQSLGSVTPGGSPIQFVPVFQERLGSYTIAGGALNDGDFTPTREQDQQATVFGGIGMPQSWLNRDPWMFATPIFWPRGQTMGIRFVPKDPKWQKAFQRWLSLTGGSAGVAGADLALPFSPILTGPGGLSPTTGGATIMTELTEDPGPALVPVSQQIQTKRCEIKVGRMKLEVGLVGRRVPQSWNVIVGQAISAGLIQAPCGYGSIPVP
jgi:hypothetical protein